MLAGVIAYAVSIEEAIAHPASSLPPATAIALALGLILFVSGMAAALWRATGTLPIARTILSIAIGLVIVVGTGFMVITTLGLALIGIIAVSVVEKRKSSPISNDQPRDKADRIRSEDPRD